MVIGALVATLWQKYPLLPDRTICVPGDWSCVPRRRAPQMTVSGAEGGGR
jgi:hypothetical protein